jgi:hypothetical protein
MTASSARSSSVPKGSTGSDTGSGSGSGSGGVCALSLAFSVGAFDRGSIREARFLGATAGGGGLFLRSSAGLGEVGSFSGAAISVAETWSETWRILRQPEYRESDTLTQSDYRHLLLLQS